VRRPSQPLPDRFITILPLVHASINTGPSAGAPCDPPSPTDASKEGSDRAFDLGPNGERCSLESVRVQSHPTPGHAESGSRRPPKQMSASRSDWLRRVGARCPSVSTPSSLFAAEGLQKAPNRAHIERASPRCVSPSRWLRLRFEPFGFATPQLRQVARRVLLGSDARGAGVSLRRLSAGLVHARLERSSS
jgi:hypothetical protein